MPARTMPNYVKKFIKPIVILDIVPSSVNLTTRAGRIP